MRQVTLYSVIALIATFCVAGCQTQKLQTTIKTQQEKIDEFQQLYTKTSAMLSNSEKQAANCQQELQAANTKSAVRITALEDELGKLKTENEALRHPQLIKQGVEEIKAMQRRAAEQLKKREPNEPNKK